MKEMVGGCCVCSDERGWPDNPLVYCDGNGCTVAVHQACYGIVTVPTGPWYCRKCESPDTKGKVRCELCPSKSGALKRSDTGGWAHVVCALYIPEVRFGNVTSMEPIVLKLIPAERFNKTCYICQEQGKSHRASAGACMQCNKSGCKQQFHVTCAQSLGLLCEEAGNYLDNVKYCGYCQHHYSKLKKGGNVKTIPPYKPVTHDSQSSDSSGEKEGDASPKLGGGTPTHPAKAKAAGRKSSHTPVPGKSTPNSSKTPTNTSQPMETSAQDSPAPETAAPGRKNKHADKNKSKKSPARRGSSAGDSGAGGGSKSSTPAPSPQHNPESAPPAPAKASGGATPKSSASAAGPLAVKSEGASVISTAPVASGTVTATVSTPSATSVVQAGPGKPHQESVITNAEAMESKQTKKRKAVSAAAANPVDYATNLASLGDVGGPSASSMWDNSGHHSSPSDITMDAVEKIVKKAKTEGPEGGIHNPHYGANPPPPPPPAHSPSPLPSPRHPNIPSPMPGPSGVTQPSNIRSPQQQGGRERESLLVSVPLPTQRLNLTAQTHAHPQLAGMQNEHPGTSPHRFHQVQKQVALDQGASPHATHPTHAPGRSGWGGLNVNYEMQDPNKAGISGSANKDASTSVGGGTVRNKKRASMATSVVSMVATGSPTMPSPGVQMLANVRRPPPAAPPPVYQEAMKDSPPSSPSSEKPLKPKVENKIGGCAAPHMLGNELNPESGVAARLQEQLSAELAAHACGNAPSPLVPPPLMNKGASTSGSRSSSSGAQSLDQLLERQWEQGSQFLMEQAQHFDIASLLSCLHQLRTENVRLEEHVGSLLQRRDHLLAVNARLAIPLTAQQSVSTGAPEPGRCPRENGAQMRAPAGPARGDVLAADRSHQMMVRDVQQKPS